MKYYVIGMALVISVGALASVTMTPSSTVKPGQYVLHKKLSTVVPAPFDKDGSGGRFNDADLCRKGAETAAQAAGTSAIEFQCDQSTGVTVTFVQTSTCADEKAPKLYLAKEKSAEDGKDYWVLPGASWTADTYIEVATLYVHGPSWPAGYPNCWVRGETPRDGWRMNSKDEPGKAFMEIRTPDMPPGDLVAEETSEMEPTWHTPEQKAALEEFNVEWQAREDASAAACAGGDTTQCPPKRVLMGACGDFRSVECGGPGIIPGVNDNQTLGIP